jgi:hypothetical protein
MASSLLSEMSNANRSIRIGIEENAATNNNETNEIINTKRVVNGGGLGGGSRAYAPKSCSIAVPYSYSRHDNNNTDYDNNNFHLYNAAHNTNNFNITSEYSPRIARSYYKHDSSFDESSHPSSFTSSFINSHHKKHRNHFYSHYINGLVFF